MLCQRVSEVLTSRRTIKTANALGPTRPHILRLRTVRKFLAVVGHVDPRDRAVERVAVAVAVGVVVGEAGVAAGSPHHGKASLLKCQDFAVVTDLTAVGNLIGFAWFSIFSIFLFPALDNLGPPPCRAPQVERANSGKVGKVARATRVARMAAPRRLDLMEDACFKFLNIFFTQGIFTN